MMPKKILINYANKEFKESQKFNTKTGLEIGGFDRVIEYSPKDIDKKFYEKNKHILTQVRGAGYWLWKPYFILKTLKRKDIKYGDFIFYLDSGLCFVDKIDYIINLSKKYDQDIIPFGSKKNIEKKWTKKDAFLLMGLNEKKYQETPQYGGGYILIKKTPFSISFFEDFLKYAQDERIITDSHSKIGKDYPDFIENRHDQSIFSLLCKKNNLKLFRTPSQYGNEEKDLFEDKYPQIFDAHGKNTRSLIEKIKYRRACSKDNIDFLKKFLKSFLNKIKK